MLTSAIKKQIVSQNKKSNVLKVQAVVISVAKFICQPAPTSQSVFITGNESGHHIIYLYPETFLAS